MVAVLTGAAVIAAVVTGAVVTGAVVTVAVVTVGAAPTACETSALAGPMNDDCEGEADPGRVRGLRR
jgi:hypothetical protein